MAGLDRVTYRDETKFFMKYRCSARVAVGRPRRVWYCGFRSFRPFRLAAPAPSVRVARSGFRQLFPRPKGRHVDRRRFARRLSTASRLVWTLAGLCQVRRIGCDLTPLTCVIHTSEDRDI